MSYKTVWIEERDLARIAWAVDEIENPGDLRDVTSTGRAPGGYALNVQQKLGVSDQRMEWALVNLGLYDTVAATLRASEDK